MDKKKGRGAIIGGLVGAGGGYLIGRGEDRKSGRVQPKN
ncbi:glycine zipper domain-containing protein [Pedobacter sp. P26]